VKLVPAQSGICGFEVTKRVQFYYIINKGGVNIQSTELAVRVTLCFAKGGINISTINSYPAFVGMSVFVCGQKVVILTFLKEDYYV